MKWSINISKIYRSRISFWILPCISLVYDKYHFLETGVATPAFIFQISFLNFYWGVTIQQSYE